MRTPTKITNNYGTIEGVVSLNHFLASESANPLISRRYFITDILIFVRRAMYAAMT